MSKIEVDAIEPQSGTTLTLGASGDSVNIASGATITGFTSTGIDDNATSTAITIDSSENVGIGTSSPVSLGSNITTLEITGGSTIRQGGIYLSNSDKSVKSYFYGTNALTVLATESNIPLAFSTNNTERMRIDSSGNVGIGTSTPIYRLHTEKNINGDIVAMFDNTGNSTPYGIFVDFSAASPDDRTRYFLTCQDSTTTRLRIWSDGDVQNHDGTYGTLSDERIKQNITNANSQWNDIKALQFKNFKKKDDVAQYGEENADVHLGLIAQELEQVSPHLVKEYACSENEASLHSDFTDWENATVKGVKYSILYMKAVKALQEAMERIETLEAKVTALENK